MGWFIGIGIEIGIEIARIDDEVDSDSDSDSDFDALHEVAVDKLRIAVRLQLRQLRLVSHRNTAYNMDFNMCRRQA